MYMYIYNSASFWYKRHPFGVKWLCSLERVDPTGDKYRGTSLIRNSICLGPFSKTLNRALWWP